MRHRPESERIGRFLPWVWVGLSLVLVLVLIGGSGCSFNINLGPRVAPLKEKVISGGGDNKVLLVEIEGVISNKRKRNLAGAPVGVGMVERIREILSKAEEDDAIKALWVRVNSPGGTVTSSDMIYHELKEIKKKKGVKIYVSFMGLAASGGYYVAMAGDKIYAHPTTITGSIGVIALKPNLEGLLEKLGVDFEVVKSGDKKDFLSPLRPFTVEERRIFQNMIDEFHQRFVRIIAENRPELDISDVQALADGRIFTSRLALEKKLIDQIAYLDEVEEDIKKDLGLSEVKIITYHRPGRYKTNLYSTVPGPTQINLLNINMDLLPRTTGPYFMYLWWP